MQSTPQEPTSSDLARRQGPPAQAGNENAAKSRLDWVLLVLVSAMASLGLASAISLVMSEHSGSSGPGGMTEAVLLALLSMSLVFFSLHYRRQQRKLAELRQELFTTQRLNKAKVHRHFDRLVAILHVSRTVSSANNPQAVLDAITGSCRETFECDRVTLMLVNRETFDLEVRSASGHENLDEVIGVKVRMGESVAGWVAEHREPVLLGPEFDTSRFKHFLVKADGPTTAMVVPILLRGELVGVLNVTSLSPHAGYSEEDLQALRVLAENAGICCRHAEQSEWMRQTIQRLDSELLKNPNMRSAA